MNANWRVVKRCRIAIAIAMVLGASLCTTAPFLHAAVAVFNQESVFDDKPHWPLIRVDGENKVVDQTSRAINPADCSDVFANIPVTLNLSYISLSFAANRTSMLGNLVNLSGTNRIADHVEAVLVTWATAEKYPSWADLDPTGYTHPVTAHIYQFETNNSGKTELRELESSELLVHIPWRPTTLPDGSPYPYNGYAFKVTLPLSGQIPVSNSPIIAVSFDTQYSGITPIGNAGPYNELNMALSGLKPRIGSDPDYNSVFWVKDGQWIYPATNWSGVGSPMFRLATRSLPIESPVLRNSPAPVHAGFYHVRSVIEGGASFDTVTTIRKAKASIAAVDEGRSIWDSNRWPLVNTTPPGLPYSITSEGTNSIPAIPGTHPYHITINSPDHEGVLDGQVRLTAPRYDQWVSQMFPGDGTPDTGPQEDPDHDGSSNLMEYCTGGNPLGADLAGSIQILDGKPGFNYRARREMPGIGVTANFSTDLLNWIEPTYQTTDTDSEWEYRRISSITPRGFFRLRCDTN